MKYGISVPNFGEYFDPRTVATLAHEAESAGWDGFFVWDHMQFLPGFNQPVNDPWITLSAIAMRTERIRLGPLVTPVPRRRPWKLARETVTLDHLSRGRLVLGVGLGFPPDAEFTHFGEEGSDRVRAGKLDEGLEILTGLWRGEPFSFNGQHFDLEEMTFLPQPLQNPRIPIWVAGYWPSHPPFRRAARWDGVAPGSRNVNWDETMPVDEVRAMLSYIHEYRIDSTPFDVVIAGMTPGDDPAKATDIVTTYRDAGATWWVENVHGYRGPFDQMRERIRQGPPVE